MSDAWCEDAVYLGFKQDMEGAVSLEQLQAVGLAVRKHTDTLSPQALEDLRNVYRAVTRTLTDKSGVSSPSISRTESSGELSSSPAQLKSDGGDDYIVVEDPLVKEQPHLQPLQDAGGSAAVEAPMEPEEPPPPKTKQEIWAAVFERPDFYYTLKTAALGGRNRGAAFRGMCWRLFLDVLSDKREEWVAQTQKNRAEYSNYLATLFIDPTKVENVDLSLNNPLSQEDDSPWQQYFQDTELKDEIRRDVSRTYPEVDFFQNPKTQDAMLNILFVYARTNPDICYRQGMHELLAPIIYVMEEERYRSENTELAGEYTDEMKILLDEKYAEHDAYSVFCKIMEVTKTWFVSQKEKREEPRKASLPNKPKTAETLLFQSQQQDREDPDSVIQHKLHRIHSVVLKQFDEELYHRMQVLDIPPQIYGLRWVRVLLNREFSLSETLILWDALFADSINLDLVDYLCVALLTYIRDFVLANPYHECLRLLMKFPPVEDAHLIVQQALHIRTPMSFPAVNWTLIKKEREQAAQQKAQQEGANNNHNEKSDHSHHPQNHSQQHKEQQKSVGILQVAAMSSMSLINAVASSAKSFTQVAAPVPAKPAHSNTVSHSTSTSTIHERPAASYSAARVSSNSPQARRGTLSKSDKETEEKLQKRIDDLTRELEELKTWNKHYGSKLENCINQLQKEVLQSERLPDEDVIYLSLAGMKEVKDVLKGLIKPDPLGFSIRKTSHEEPETPEVVDLSYANMGPIEVSPTPSQTTSRAQSSAAVPSSSDPYDLEAPMSMESSSTTGAKKSRSAKKRAKQAELEADMNKEMTTIKYVNPEEDSDGEEGDAVVTEDALDGTPVEVGLEAPTASTTSTTSKDDEPAVIEPSPTDSNLLETSPTETSPTVTDS